MSFGGMLTGGDEEAAKRAQQLQVEKEVKKTKEIS